MIGLLTCGISWSCPTQIASGEEFSEQKSDAEQFLRDRVGPFIRTYCIDCHSNRRPTEGGVNFNPALKDPGHAAFSQTVEKGGREGHRTRHATRGHGATER